MPVSITPFSLSLSRPLETARGKIEAREGFVVAVGKGERRGIGEATPLAGWTESLTDCERALRRAIEASETSGKTGETDPERALDAVSGKETPVARHGLAMAISDRRARERKVPLYRHLGGTQRTERVPVNATIGDGTPEETTLATEEAIDDGFRCLKVKVGARAIEADAARLRAVRERVANAEADTRIEIRADANGAWSLGEARRALTAFEDEGGKGNEREGKRTGITYVEQPLSPTDLAGHATLRAESEIPIALDESLTEHSIEAIRDAGAADVVICKPMALGGLDRAREFALRAREAGIDPVVTTTIDGAIGRAGATHLAASLAPIDACGLATADLLCEDLVGSDPTPITDGYALVPQKSGVFGENPRTAAIGESDS